MTTKTIIACRKLWCLSACEKSASSLSSFFRYVNHNANLLFWGHCIGHVWLWLPKTMVLACREIWCLSLSKNSNLPLTYFWNIARMLQACYFGYFEHAWAHSQKPIASAWSKLWCKSQYKMPKVNVIPLFFLEILHLK